MDFIGFEIKFRELLDDIFYLFNNIIINLRNVNALNFH